jgi:hypothetical protein
MTSGSDSAAAVQPIGSNAAPTPQAILAPGSFDARRELAIEVDDADATGALHDVVKHDSKHSEALDLTDEGLLADLTKRGMEASAAGLVLDVPAAGKKR